MIGGYTGSPEGTAIASIATDLLQFPICGAHLPARNSRILMNKTIKQAAGPFTEMFFGINRGGSCKNHLTPIECWFSAAVFKGACGLSLEAENEICKEVILQFEKDLNNPPKGMAFQDLFNVKTLEPVPEYKEMYFKMRKYAQELGISMPGDGVIC